jgi:hypothetical protein
MAKSKALKKFSKFILWFNGIATLVWAVLIFPSATVWKESITWVVLMSAWANFASHFAAFISAIIENEGK